MAATLRVTSHHGSSDDASTTDVQGTSLYFRQSDSDASGGNVPHNGAGFNSAWSAGSDLSTFAVVATSRSNVLRNCSFGEVFATSPPRLRFPRSLPR